MKKRFMWIILILVIVALSIKIYLDTNDFKVNTVQLESNKMPESTEITLVQISDLHNHVFGDQNDNLIDTVKKLNADVIVITGDLIDRGTESFENMYDLIEKLTVINERIYFVSGNHEWDNEDTENFFNGLRERNVSLLNNTNTQIEVNGMMVNIVGVDDSSTDHENIEEAFDGIDQEIYTILLSHSPGIVSKYEAIPADLILSGHTHGGQVRVPFIGAIVAPDQGFFPELDKGTFTIGPEQTLYIDSGLGTSIAPIRFLNKSQMSYIRITNNK
ncbi:metallophosphoesterase [Aquibacillus koreensis]|uniref:Metallophosphoesterase n=1 Tax=Aquibacillus koreensis TaxID=279446 RepID=A0A9X3WJE7_9BACI|nr:metallophosphoesterase [Aquibacillus koreensis]MCT2534705.1 metallophosphoesterase [Aquibacillus koreensis]MDC3419685.1 metallophosphoesterase [Aquibacillus koreensis]